MALPYLRVNSIELANQAVVSEYLAHSTVSGYGYITCVCDALYDNPATGLARVLTMPNGAGGGVVAPWYTSEFPESADFLGIGIEELKGVAGENVKRTNVDRIAGPAGGTVLGPLHLSGKKLDVKALLISQSEAGDEYGIRWVNSVLQSECTGGGCTPYDVEYRAFCPETDFDQGRWYLRRCGVTTGLTWQTAVQFANCYVREFTFTIQSELPYVYSLPAEVVAPTTLYAASCVSFDTWVCGGPLVQATITPPAFGDLCPILALNSGTGPVSGNMQINGVVQYWFGNIPAGCTFTIDSSLQTFTLTNNSTGVSIGGTPYLILSNSQTITWPIANCGNSVTVGLQVEGCSSNASTTGAISTTLRQL